MKPTNLFSVLIFRSWQDIKKKVVSLTKYGMLWTKMYIIPGTCIIPSAHHLFIYQKQLVSDSFPYGPVCSCHTALCEETICWFEVERSCAEPSQATCFLSDLTLRSVSLLKQNSDMNWTFPLFISSPIHQFWPKSLQLHAHVSPAWVQLHSKTSITCFQYIWRKTEITEV